MPGPPTAGAPSIPSTGSARKTDPGDYLFHEPTAHPNKRHCRDPSRGHPTWPSPRKEQTPHRYNPDNYRALAEGLGFGKEEIITLARNSIIASFLDDDRKQELLTEVSALSG
jgi:hypothetical protein